MKLRSSSQDPASTRARRVTLRRAALASLFALLVMLAPATESSEAPVDTATVMRGAERGAPVTPLVLYIDVRQLPSPAPWKPGDPIREIPRRSYVEPGQQITDLGAGQGIDRLLEVQETTPRAVEDARFAEPEYNFSGQGFTGVNPPDTVGDVGPDHYIQMINAGGGSTVVIHDKALPTPNVLASFALDSLGSGVCASGAGDPIALYDRLAGRWLLSEFSGSGNNLCVYISQTSDPVSGGWYAYGFAAPSFPDYPKYAVWPTDANGGGGSYVVTSNEGGSGIYALDRAAMLAGESATLQRFVIGDLPGFPFNAVTPGDLDGAVAPPVGVPAVIMRHRDTEVHSGPAAPEDLLEMWHYQVDWNDEANTTLTKLASIDVAEFESDLCGLSSFACIPQPGTGTTLDPLREVIMNRLQYQNFEDHETLVGNFVVDVDGSDHGGLRWFELRRVGGGAAPWTLFQEGTYAPDGDNRWMAASAMDQSGNIAIAYNVSSSSTFPSLRYTGRLVDDAPGTMPQAETSIVAGTASNSSNRYGDYASMNLDPADDCTFWFTGMYNASSNWSTQIAAFGFEACGCLLAPSPLQVTAQVSGDNEVEVGWDDADLDTVVEYEIVRSRTLGGPYETIALVADASPGVAAGPDQFFTDTDVSGGTTYYYVVKANDGATCKSDPSNEASVTATGECTLPPDFGGVQTVSTPFSSTCTLDLFWGAGAANCGGGLTYNVYRSVTPAFVPGQNNRIASQVIGTSFSDFDQLVDGTAYHYVVRAVDAVTGVEESNGIELSGIPQSSSGTCQTGSACIENPFVDVGPDGPLTVCVSDIPLLEANTSSGSGAFFYQWTQDGVDIPGATGATYQPQGLGTHAYNVRVHSESCASEVADGIETTITAEDTPHFAGLVSATNLQNGTCSVDLDWGAGSSVCDGPVRYFVYRDTTSPVSTSADRLVASGVLGTSYTDTAELVNGTTYHYLVRAQDATTGRFDTNVEEDSATPDGPGGGVQPVFDEDFEDPGALAAWTVTTGPGPHNCGEWAVGSSSTKRPSGGSGSYAIADNECGMLLNRTSTTLTSPPIDVNLTNLFGVTLEYDIYFNYDSGNGNEYAAVEVWDGAQWVVLWSSGTSDLNGHQVFDVTSYAAGNPAFQVRFDYQHATQDRWMSLDNVQVITDRVETCETTTGPSAVPDGGAGSAPLRGERGSVIGDVLQTSWDAASCPASDYNLIWGDLADVGSYLIAGSECALGPSGSFTWSTVPPGDLFFLVVGTDGVGVESSWGLDGNAGERAVSGASGECGTTTKDASNVCP